jgi:hypothetical protein
MKKNSQVFRESGRISSATKWSNEINHKNLQFERKGVILRNHLTMEDVDMNTITLDAQLYKRAEAFAKSHNTSVKQLIESYIHTLVNDTKNKKSELDLAREDLKAGRILSYSSKEELYKDLGITSLRPLSSRYSVHRADREEERQPSE